MRLPFLFIHSGLWVGQKGWEEFSAQSTPPSAALLRLVQPREDQNLALLGRCFSEENCFLQLAITRLQEFIWKDGGLR